jgi:trans-2,3-dihydro-3-hydroxyanthranilate isomerase
MPIAYEVVDVFTTVRFGGNPLAVVLDGRSLSSLQMQQIAAEFGFSETTFVLPPQNPQHTAQVRIFTPTTEVPFAGHPNVGTAFVLARLGTIFGQPVGEAMVFEEQAGLVAVRVLREGNTVVGAAITAPRALELGAEVPLETIAACASLTVEDIATASHMPRYASVGLPFAVAELRSREALARAKPDLAAFSQVAGDGPVTDHTFSLFLYLPTPQGPATYSARMFAPLDNVLEDPATGSASAALAAYRVALLPEANASVELTIEQGVDMGRPSLLRLQVEKTGGTIQRVEVGGACVPVMRGEFIMDSHF